MFSGSSTTSSSVGKSTSSSGALQKKMDVSGANAGMARGADPSLLRNARMATVGAQKALAKGQSNMARGQNRGLARGANRDLCVGSNSSLCKGPQQQRGV